MVKRKTPKNGLKLPACFYDRQGFTQQLQIAMEARSKEHEVTVLTWYMHKDFVFSSRIHLGQLGTEDSNARFVLHPKSPEQEALKFKGFALRNGATLEAIQFLRELIPLTKEEETIMAEKLKTKAAGKAKSDTKAPKNGDADALKAAAKEAPVGGKKNKAAATDEKPANRRGNPEALAKARAARGDDGFAKQKIKVLVKPKDSGLRDGSDRQHKLEFVARHKVVSDVLGQEYTNGKKIDRGSLAGMVKRGHIELV